jgi:hypothetical protein
MNIRHSASVGLPVKKLIGTWYIAAACSIVSRVASANCASSSEIGIGTSSAPPPTPMTLPALPVPLCCASTDLIHRLPVSSSMPSGNFRPMPGKIPFARWRSSNSARLRPAETSIRAAVIGESPSSPSLRLRLRIWMISSVPRVTGLPSPVRSLKTTAPVVFDALGLDLAGVERHQLDHARPVRRDARRLELADVGVAAAGEVRRDVGLEPERGHRRRARALEQPPLPRVVRAGAELVVVDDVQRHQRDGVRDQPDHREHRGQPDRALEPPPPPASPAARTCSQMCSGSTASALASSGSSPRRGQSLTRPPPTAGRAGA